MRSIFSSSHNNGKSYFSVLTLFLSLLISIFGGLVVNSIWPTIAQIYADRSSNETLISATVEVKNNYIRELPFPKPLDDFEIQLDIDSKTNAQLSIKEFLIQRLTPRGYNEAGISKVIADRIPIFNEIGNYIHLNDEKYLKAIDSLKSRVQVLSSCSAVVAQVRNISPKDITIRELDLPIPSSVSLSLLPWVKKPNYRQYLGFYPDDVFTTNHNNFTVSTTLNKKTTSFSNIDAYIIEWADGLVIPAKSSITCIFAVPSSHSSERSLVNIDATNQVIHNSIIDKGAIILSDGSRHKFRPKKQKYAYSSFNWPIVAASVLLIYIIILLLSVKFKYNIAFKMASNSVDPTVIEAIVDQKLKQRERDQEKEASRNSP